MPSPGPCLRSRVIKHTPTVEGDLSARLHMSSHSMSETCTDSTASRTVGELHRKTASLSRKLFQKTRSRPTLASFPGRHRGERCASWPTAPHPARPPQAELSGDRVGGRRLPRKQPLPSLLPTRTDLYQLLDKYLGTLVAELERTFLFYPGRVYTLPVDPRAAVAQGSPRSESLILVLGSLMVRKKPNPDVTTAQDRVKRRVRRPGAAPPRASGALAAAGGVADQPGQRGPRDRLAPFPSPLCPPLYPATSCGSTERRGSRGEG